MGNAFLLVPVAKAGGFRALFCGDARPSVLEVLAKRFSASSTATFALLTCLHVADDQASGIEYSAACMYGHTSSPGRGPRAEIWAGHSSSGECILFMSLRLCTFDRPTLYFCLQIGSDVVVGSRGADLVWMYDSSKMFNLAGRPVAVRYQSPSIWIMRPDGKEMHLKEDCSNDVFSNSACSASVRLRWIQKFAAVAIPRDVSPAAILVPLTVRSYFWVHCHFDTQEQWDVCLEWDSKGIPDTQKRELVDPSSHRGVLDAVLTIDPLTTKDKAALHLKNGIVLRDWAKGRINGHPAPGSVPPNP